MTRVFMTSLRRAAILLPSLGFILLASCGFFVSESSIQSVAVTPTTAILKIGDTPADTYTLSSTSTTVGKTQTDDTSTATWNSSNTNVVSVAAGVLTAGSTAGTATVTATDGGKTSNAVNVLTYSVATPQNLLVIANPVIASGGSASPGTYQFRAFLGTSTSAPEVTNFVTWSTDQTTVAAVSTIIPGQVVLNPPPTGLATTVTITATANVGASAPATQSTIQGSLQFTVL